MKNFILCLATLIVAMGVFAADKRYPSTEHQEKFTYTPSGGVFKCGINMVSYTGGTPVLQDTLLGAATFHIDIRGRKPSGDGKYFVRSASGLLKGDIKFPPAGGDYLCGFDFDTFDAEEVVMNATLTEAATAQCYAEGVEAL